MAIAFRDAAVPGLAPLTGVVPNGAVVGVTGEAGSGIDLIAALAAGRSMPEGGAVTAGPDTFVHDRSLETLDALARARAAARIERQRRAGASVLIVSHDASLLRTLCDEVWWMDHGSVRMRSTPAEVLAAYDSHVAHRLAELAAAEGQPLAPSMRRGDGRAVVESIVTLDAAGNPAAIWRSGEEVSVAVAVKFHAAVADPVIGIMIRTRIGFEVYGTNTELEQVRIGPVEAGQVVDVRFSFVCGLCPQAYTLTVASHDPDGVWHDWLEDAIAFSVADSRYTAGVANLRARVTRSIR